MHRMHTQWIIQNRFNAPDFSDAVDAEIGAASGFDSIEGNLALWLDLRTLTVRIMLA